MKKTGGQLYCDYMKEARDRLYVIWQIETNSISISPQIGKLELMALQLRKTLELIALGSLISHRDIFVKNYQSLEKAWNAKFILRDIERVHKDFYPKPVELVPSPDPIVREHLVPLAEGFLDRDTFLVAYDKCSSLLHSPNPFGPPPSLEYFESNIPTWTRLAAKLLDKHLITLLNGEYFLIHMREDDGLVHHYTLTPQ